jgi:hypothetical protein
MLEPQDNNETELTLVGEPWAGLGFDKRQMDEISFAKLYAISFSHGTDDHHRLLLIAQLSKTVGMLMKDLDALRRSMNGDTSAMREVLAELAHEQWSGWMKYFLGKCNLAGTVDGALIVPGPYFENIWRQIETPYHDLSEVEKESDRQEADKVLALLFAKKEVAHAD